MRTGMSTVIHPVHDLGRAKAVHGALFGSAPVTDEAYYVEGQQGDPRHRCCRPGDEDPADGVMAGLRASSTSPARPGR